ncbi:MAG: ABC transporter permease [Chloroflexi bacterium]|nr:ABC transporter permease [Chloroflexota bacterium]
MERARRYAKRNWQAIVVPCVFIAACFLIWEGIVRLGIWKEYLLPSPATVFDRIGHSIKNDTIPRAIGYSMKRLAIGYFISIAIGVVSGMAIARFKIVEQSLGVVVTGFQALPSITWLPLALLWFGLNDRAIIFVVVLGSVMAITQSTADGIKSIPTIYFRTARNLGASGLALYLRVVFPASLPHVTTGMKLGWSFAWRSLMAAELIFVTPGLGHLLDTGRQFNDVSQVMAIMLVIVALGLLMDRLVFARLEKWVRVRWGFAGINA